ncbi:regulator of chromosome condensation (RCC1) protein [Rutstroemia sp. NJR-2017a BBW]|nr:regulator of chromosome condensation (RCC1) protein [Rutstroemia sp. NJR-2017a BBW]
MGKLMELWACGFNAWGQLQFAESASRADNDEPEDITTFTRVLLARGSIRIIETSFSACLVGISDGASDSPEQVKVAGFPDGFLKARLDNINKNGGTPDLNSPILSISTISDQYLPTPEPYNNITSAGNDKIATFTTTHLTQYPSLPTYLSHSPDLIHPLSESTSLVSNHTTFTALTTTNRLLTWGDARFPSRLGRPSTTPSNIPSPIPPSTLPESQIVKLSSGGPLSGFLTSSKDLYIWGSNPHPFIPELNPSSPSYIDPDEENPFAPVPIDIEGKDVADVAIGENHVLVLTTDGMVYGIGECGNGQLGFGEERGRCEEWRVLDVGFEKKGKRCVGVGAGYKCSFVLVEDV